ncbi:TlpA family protein disulfide reductase [Pontibacter cellulosilyticus]|uniref:TlpA family protein disulfide reductase n=1 Tax=Pontibacter cellulosilyticus TaxID=1720253 RepID=A0A923SJW6_9BACT|nr:TlpA disulfide reductase family protein [Pontibacter cellulosilyticus]MBC5994102.1 TlpA family protein disulfide reductase [Pontibacter cellulosilyticus]
MKHKPILLALALLLQVQAVFAQGKAIITGKISNPLSDEIVVATTPNPLIPEEVQTAVQLKGGSFRLEVPVNGAIVAELLHGEEVVPVYLEPGYELNLAFNGDKFLKTLKFEGKGANENNYLVQYTRRFEEVEEYQVMPDNIKLTEKEFTAFLDYRKKDQLKNLEKYTTKSPVSDKFRKFALAEINFGYANDKITYHSLRENVLMTTRLQKPSAEFYTFLKELDLQSQENLLSYTFTTFLRNYAKYNANEAGLKESDKAYFKTAYSSIVEKLQGQVKAVAQADILKQSIQQGHLKYTTEMLQDFKSINKNPELEAYFTKLYNENKEFAIGSPAPDFQLKDVNGAAVSLSDFKGKLVYLNFWSTICGLCMVEMPNMQQLTEQLKGKNVVFLNVGLDEDEAKWKITVTGRKLQGVHLYLKGMDAELVKRYNLKDIPAYFMIDEEGNFISIKPRRPTDRETANDILKHINEGQASAK